MKNQIQKLFIMLALLFLCDLHSGLSTAQAQGAAFTYNGQLNSGGSSANASQLFSGVTPAFLHLVQQ